MERLTYSVAEAAQATGTSEGHVRRMVKDGTIPHTRLGGRVLIPADALREYLERQTKHGYGGAREGEEG